MNHMQVQQEVAAFIKATASTVNKAYFWRLSGDAPNSLCRFLGMEEEKLKNVLRLCKIYVGDKDNFSKNNFEILVLQCETDWTTYRLHGKAERFIRLGQGGTDVVLPKDQYDSSGVLSYYPVEDEHVRNLRTKSQRGTLHKLLLQEGGTTTADRTSITESLKGSCPNKKQVEEVDSSPKSLLYSFVQELVLDAGKSGETAINW
jgi:hypothetical protein